MLVDVVARRARQIADEAEETGEHLTEKPRHPGHPGGGGRQAGRHDSMDLTIEEPEDCSRRRKQASNNRRGEAWKPLRS